ncbi:MAG: guanine deaminase [Gemmatimonadota bacterium]
MRLLLVGRLITPLAGGDALDLLPGWVAVDGSGCIVRAGPGRPPAAFRGFAVTDLRRFVATPGFVDTHLHYPQIDARGRMAPDLLSWLERHVFPAEEACADPHVARSLAARTFRELARNGVTTAAVHGSPHGEATELAFEEARRSGLRVFLGKVMMERNGPEALLQTRERNLELSRRLCRRWDGESRGRLRYAFAPRFAPACSFELLRDTARVARELGALVQTHLSESAREVAWVRELFPRATSYTDVYREAGLLAGRALLAHGVHLEDREWDTLRSTGAALAHCPTSNFFLRSGAFDLARAMRDGVRFGLGSDVGAGPSFSPFDVMRHASYLAPITPVEALQRATLCGAEALGVADRTGSLEPEKDADLALLDPQVLETPLDAPIDSLLGAFIHRGSARVVAGTLAGGEWVHADPALPV